MPRSWILFASAVAATSSCTKMTNLVTFGDSLTDEGLLDYWFANNGTLPPPGTHLPAGNSTYIGGRPWGRLVADQTGVEYYNYGISAAACSDEVVTRFWEPLGDDFPSVLEDQIPRFEADVDLEGALDPDGTVYALWIGTNDIGYHGFLLDKQVEGKNLPALVDCQWETFDRVYAAGGRNFILMNQMPLDATPTYAPPSDGGRGNNIYWPDYERYNMTGYQGKVQQYTTSVNRLSEQGAAFHMLVQERWPSARVTVLDVHSLMMDIRENPGRYLAAPAKAVGFYHRCEVDDPSSCVDSDEPADSFMWYDELHPSERVSEVIADEFVEAVKGRSKYATVYKPRPGEL